MFHLVTIAACRQTRTGKRNRRERGKMISPPQAPHRETKKKGNSIPMDPKLKKEKEKPEASVERLGESTSQKKGFSQFKGRVQNNSGINFVAICTVTIEASVDTPRWNCSINN